LYIHPDMKREFPESETVLHRFLAATGAYRVLVLDSPAPGAALADAHDLSGAFRNLFLQGVNAAALMAADLKQTMKLILQVKWEAGGFSVEADWRGNIRGYVRNPEAVEYDFRNAPVLGGTIAVIRMIGSHPGYTGYGSLFGYNLEGALRSHYAGSEQNESHFSLESSHPAMIQRMPDAQDETDLGECFGKLLPDIAAATVAEERDLIGRFGLTRLESGAVRISCSCSRDSIATYIRGLDPGELRSLYEESPWPVVVNCDNCSSSYEFSRDEISGMLAHRGL
jgi:molecular chaperone Hsp33